QLLDRIKMVFPAIPDGWDWDVAMPPFATNYTVLYEREARGLPGRYNFYASLERADPAAVAAAFENQGWAMRKSGGEEMEANLSWGEISIVKDKQEVLLNGRVDFRPDHVEDLHHLLDGIAGVYQYEFYDEEGRVLLERRRPG
ncbi:MAG TPA: hypothetical protein VKQ52_04500, partial [Puia sp.]|nr:hypothetical protein [Puia sp.]